MHKLTMCSPCDVLHFSCAFFSFFFQLQEERDMWMQREREKKRVRSREQERDDWSVRASVTADPSLVR